CDMGLYESVAPINVDDKIVGYIMIGQILTMSGKNVVKENIAKECDERDKLYEILNSMQIISADKLTASAYLMSICAEYLCAYKGISNKIIGRAKKIENYIKENMSEKISVETLANEFNLSRTTLHNMFKESFSHSVTEHIIYLRMEKAKELLKRGDELKSVCQSVGIEDKNYFCRVFKIKTGVTVKEYLFSCGKN
ncbi:MAG: helix-turn-helix domain-containing protein, partial [Clostridia bacterium]